MSKQIYISVDYSEDSGDRDVVEILNKWGADKTVTVGGKSVKLYSD